MTACTLAPRLPRLDLTIHRAWPIAAMVGGFMLWWPLGLALLALWKAAPLLGVRFAGGRLPELRRWPADGSGNSAFDAHRAAVLRRLEEERRALDGEQAEFATFVQKLRDAKDREEFDRFMAQRRGV